MTAKFFPPTFPRTTARPCAIILLIPSLTILKSSKKKTFTEDNFPPSKVVLAIVPLKVQAKYGLLYKRRARIRFGFLWCRISFCWDGMSRVVFLFCFVLPVSTG